MATNTSMHSEMDGRCTAALCSSLRRLSHQLRVDFAMDVHGSGEKRRREPTRSIYEEAALRFEKEKNARRTVKKRKTQHQARNEDGATEIKTAKRTGKIIFPSKKHAVCPAETSADISEIDEHVPVANAEPLEHGEAMLMHAAAASLAQLAAKDLPAPSCMNGQIAFVEQTMVDAMSKAHSEVLAAKDEAIRATVAALAAKDELVKAQAAMIAMMMQAGARSRE